MADYVMADPHFCHNNIIKFTDETGRILRPFNSVEEHDQKIIDNCNEKMSHEDKLYVLGDVAINKKGIKKFEQINAKCCLIKGNHDIFKLKDYIPYFYDVRAYRVFPEHKTILSHIPIHPFSMERWVLNIHGHLHYKTINDKRYLNVCLENTNFKPVRLDQLFHVAERLGELE